jgi:glycosyltransferase involved in cell wall biosynthesis
MYSSSARVSIIVTTQNEAENIEPLLSRIVASGVQFDDSTDGTQGAIHAQARTLPTRLIRQEATKPGLAGAIMSGAKVAQG